jgi:hypothetical protein
LLLQADVVVTNPPFSLFREYVAQLVEHQKHFLIIGSNNATTYREIFKLIRENKLWLGYPFANGNAFFSVPKDQAANYANGVYNPETGLVKFRNIAWFTNLSHKNRNEDLILFRTYAGAEGLYPRYDNYDAIEVSKVADIPVDYAGVMGVPITFLDKYNPAQFDIVDINPHFFGLVEQGLPKPSQLKITGRKDPYARILIKSKNQIGSTT